MSPDVLLEKRADPNITSNGLETALMKGAKPLPPEPGLETGLGTAAKGHAEIVDQEVYEDGCLRSCLREGSTGLYFPLKITTILDISKM